MPHDKDLCVLRLDVGDLGALAGPSGPSYPCPGIMILVPRAYMLHPAMVFEARIPKPGVKRQRDRPRKVLLSLGAEAARATQTKGCYRDF